MILPEAKKNYLNRALKAYDHLKLLSEATLDKNIAALPIQLDYVYPLKKHQKIGFLIGSKLSSFLYFYDMGLGKTALILALLRYHLKLNRMKRILILCPKSTHIYTWEDEIKLHAPDLKYCVLDDSSINRIDLINNSDANVFILNYTGVLYLGSSYIEKTKKEKGHQAVDLKKINWLISNFDSIVCDESQYISNHQSLTYKVVNLIAEQCNFRYALTGTPSGRDPQKFWAQFKVIDRGETLGKTLGMFRECFFKTKQNHWGGFEHKFLPKMTDKLHEVLKNRSLYYGAEECLNLPPKVYMNKYVSFPEEIESYYKRVIEDLKNSKKDLTVMENAFIKMRQLSSGFLSVKDEENEKQKILFKDNPKLDCLLDLIQEIPEDKKIVIFNEFIYSGDLISERLKELKIKHSRLYSGTKNVKQELDNFKSKPEYRVMLANSQSGGEGMNWAFATYCIFYESPVSSILRMQAEKRIHRIGQTQTSFIYDLIMKKTFDSRIIQYTKDGKSLMDALLNGEEL